jgi:hypothetical protein
MVQNWINTLRFYWENALLRYLPMPPVGIDQWQLNKAVVAQHVQPWNHSLETTLMATYASVWYIPNTNTTWVGLESLQVLAWLQVFIQHPNFPKSLITVEQFPTVRWLDVGSKNFGYAPAIATVLSAWQGENWQLTGIELDAGRLDVAGVARQRYAQGVVNTLPNTTVVAGDMLTHTQEYEVISLFLPFVFEDPLMAWGLPIQQFKPLAVLTHCLTHLATGGVLLIINLTQAEATQQALLFEQLPPVLKNQLSWVCVGTLPNTFIGWQHERIGWLCLKHPLTNA